jgi:hypothetical protein
MTLMGTSSPTSAPDAVAESPKVAHADPPHRAGTITSDYGTTQVASNAKGNWSARLEFPDAPLGVTFKVHITSSKGEAVYDFQLTRVGPG